MQTLVEQAKATIKPKFSIEVITPQAAAAYLAHNTGNRPLKNSWVQTLASAMRRGEWRLNGEAIKFAYDGRLIDGQNRLHAIIRSGTAQSMLIARDLDPAVFDTLDQGFKRSASDILSISGEKNTHVLAAAARAILAIENEGLFAFAYTIKQIEECVRRYPTLREWVRKLIGSKAKLLAPSVIPAVLTLGSELHGDEVADEFLSHLATGANMSATHPALVLRERLIEARAARVKQLRQVATAAYAIKAWNAYVTGKPISILRFKPNAEVFPKIQ